MDKNAIEIARTLGAPYDLNKPVSVELSEICNVEKPASVGEPVFLYNAEDSNGADTIYTAGSDGLIDVVEVKLGDAVPLTFEFLQSKLEYILIQKAAESLDVDAMARRKLSQTRALDKIELKKVLDLVLALNGTTGIPDQSVIRTTGSDIYDLIVALVRKVEDYGDNYILLAGKDANSEIEDFDKTMAEGGMNYPLPIKAMLKEKGITLIKVTEKITLDDGEDLPVLAANTLVLIARDSKNPLVGRPIVFCRRLIRDLVANAGGTVDAKQRALYIAETPLSLDAGLTHGYGIFSWESIVIALVNYRQVAYAIA